MKNKSISITEIARIAHVHPSTVSRALNGSPLVKEETRRWISGIAQAHGYVPDAVAKSLLQGKTSTLGVIVPEISNAFYAHIVDAMEQVMVQHGYSLILSGTRFDPESELRAIRTMIGKRVDALVVCAPSPQAEAQLLTLRRQLPVILCDPLQACPALDCVSVDEHAGIGAAVAYLREKGHTRIGCIADRVTRHRMDIFIAAMKSAGLDPQQQALCVSSDLSVNGGYAGLCALAERGPLPTAIFAARDNIAVGAMRAAIEMGLDIPRQLSLVGYDGIRISDFLYKKLTTIRQPASDIGQNAAQLLLRRLESGEPGTAQDTAHIRLVPELIVRESA